MPTLRLEGEAVGAELDGAAETVFGAVNDVVDHGVSVAEGNPFVCVGCGAGGGSAAGSA